MEIKKYTSYLEKCFSIAKDLKLKLIFSIHQTSNLSNINPYTLPPRKTKEILISGVCNLGQCECDEAHEGADCAKKIENALDVINLLMRKLSFQKLRVKVKM